MAATSRPVTRIGSAVRVAARTSTAVPGTSALPEARWWRVTSPDGEEQGDRDGEGSRGRPAADGRVVGQVVDVDGQPGPDGRGRANTR